MTETPHPRSFLRRRWPWLLLAAGALLAGALFIWPRSSETSRRLDRLRAAGLPTTPAELDRWYAAVPAGQNAAGPLLEGATALRGNKTDTNLPFVGAGPAPPRGRPLTEPARSLMTAFLTNNQESLELVHTALRRPHVRFPVNLTAGMNTRLPHLAPLKHTASALALEAWLAADRGEPDAAARALQDGLRLGRAVQSEPLLISGLVGIACQAIAVDAAEHVLSTGILPEPRLRELQEAFHHAATNQNFERAFAGELAMADQILHLSPSEVAQWAGPGNLATTAEFGEEAGLWLYVTVGLTRRDHAVTLNVLDELRQNAARPFPERLVTARKIVDQAERRLAQSYLPVARVFLPGTINIAGKDARQNATLAAAATACAVERFRLAHAGGPPDSLAALVPAFLDAVPRDPMDGEPLRYRLLTNGYVIYSIGEDGRDSGGIEFRKRSKKQMNSDWDYTFVVERSPAGN